MIQFECKGLRGHIDEYGFMRWGSMGMYLSDMNPSRVLWNSIAEALLKSDEVDRIIKGWFDLVTTQ